MSLDIVNPVATRTGSLIKIGAVARRFKISVDLLRLYEREGLLIPLKSSAGTRYFTEQDYPWITTLLRLIREARLNFVGVRHLLALLPCWELRQCGYGAAGDCPVRRDGRAPCWFKQKHCTSPVECYFCPVYRAAPSCEDLRQLLTTPEARTHAVSAGVVNIV